MGAELRPSDFIIVFLGTDSQDHDWPPRRWWLVEIKDQAVIVDDLEFFDFIKDIGNDVRVQEIDDLFVQEHDVFRGVGIATVEFQSFSQFNPDLVN